MDKVILGQRLEVLLHKAKENAKEVHGLKLRADGILIEVKEIKAMLEEKSPEPPVEFKKETA